MLGCLLDASLLAQANKAFHSVPAKSRYLMDPASFGQTLSGMPPCMLFVDSNKALTPPTMVQLIAALLGNWGDPEPRTPADKQQCTPLQLQC